MFIVGLLLMIIGISILAKIRVNWINTNPRDSDEFRDIDERISTRKKLEERKILKKMYEESDK